MRLLGNAGTPQCKTTSDYGTQKEERRIEVTRCLRSWEMGNHWELAKGIVMPLADYPDLSWLIRAVRVLPVVAVAALVGGIIGGFTVFAIDSALTWKPRPDLRADNQTPEEQQAPKSVRIVGGAIPDPSAGMSGPPPAQQQQQPRAASAQSPAPQVPAQLLTAKPLGAVQPLTQTKTLAQTPQAQTPQAQTPTATVQPVSSPTPTAAATQQQSTRWPDALSRAHQGFGGAQQQTEAPQPNATPERSASKNSDADRKDVGDERAGNEQAASASDEDRAGASRRGRHGRRHTMMSGCAAQRRRRRHRYVRAQCRATARRARL